MRSVNQALFLLSLISLVLVPGMKVEGAERGLPGQR